MTASVMEVIGTKHGTRKPLVDNRELIGQQTQKQKMCYYLGLSRKG
jgi:hypothetical protein